MASVSNPAKRCRLARRAIVRLRPGRPAYSADGDPSRHMAIMVRAVQPEWRISRRKACDWVTRAMAPGFAVSGLVELRSDGSLNLGVEVSSAVAPMSSFAARVNSLQNATERIFGRASLTERWKLTHEIALCRAVIRAVRENKPLQLRSALAELHTEGWGSTLTRLAVRAAAIGAFQMPPDFPLPDSRSGRRRKASR